MNHFLNHLHFTFFHINEELIFEQGLLTPLFKGNVSLYRQPPVFGVSNIFKALSLLILVITNSTWRNVGKNDDLIQVPNSVLELRPDPRQLSANIRSTIVRFVVQVRVQSQKSQVRFDVFVLVKSTSVKHNFLKIVSTLFTTQS